MKRTFHALNFHSFNYIAEGAGLSESDNEWQNNLIKFIHHTVEYIEHKCIVYNASFGMQL